MWWVISAGDLWQRSSMEEIFFYRLTMSWICRLCSLLFPTRESLLFSCWLHRMRIRSVNGKRHGGVTAAQLCVGSWHSLYKSKSGGSHCYWLDKKVNSWMMLLRLFKVHSNTCECSAKGKGFRCWRHWDTFVKPGVFKLLTRGHLVVF